MIEFEKEDLIVPTFLLALLAFVWATGTPTLNSRTVTEFESFEVDSSQVFAYQKEDPQHQFYDPKRIACSEAVTLAEVDYYGEEKVLPVARTGEVGSCEITVQVNKTVVEVYGFEVVLPQAVTPVFSISWDNGGDL